MHIISSSYLISSPEYTMCPKPDRPEYAFIGRSNVGKSSLINMLCNNQRLAKTSVTPGKTQMINHFEIKSTSPVASGGGKIKTDSWYIADLPGYGFAKVSIAQRAQWEKMIQDYLRKRENLMNVFVLLDSRHSPQAIDIEFVDKLRKWGVPFCLVFTKSDKENQRTVSMHVRAFLDEMRKSWQFLPDHVVTSTLKNTGKEKILSLIEEVNKEFSKA
jgi:GTP-binding protein